MYVCPEHGNLLNDWCNDCSIIIKCDCSDIGTARFKDLIFDCLDGEHTATVYVHHCKTCGKVKEDPETKRLREIITRIESASKFYAEGIHEVDVLKYAHESTRRLCTKTLKGENDG